jgi:hypothetical protein
MNGAPRFTLYSRSYCHLCDDMLAALQAFMARQGQAYTVDVGGVDADPAQGSRVDEQVPVLAGDPAGTEICHYVLDEAALRRHLGLQPVAAA